MVKVRRWICKDPEILQIDHFLSKEECQHIIQLSAEKMKRAQVSSELTGKYSERRTGQNCWLAHDIDSTVHQVCQRIGRQAGMSLDSAEALQVIHYACGQEYAAHYDGWDPETDRGRRCLARGGQRILTALCYLSDVESGGETAFPKLKLCIPAREGRLVLFADVVKGTTKRHPLSLHGGTTVVRGEKWACNLWFRQAV